MPLHVIRKIATKHFTENSIEINDSARQKAKTIWQASKYGNNKNGKNVILKWKSNCTYREYFVGIVILCLRGLKSLFLCVCVFVFSQDFRHSHKLSRLKMMITKQIKFIASESHEITHFNITLIKLNYVFFFTLPFSLLFVCHSTFSKLFCDTLW